MGLTPPEDLRNSLTDLLAQQITVSDSLVVWMQIELDHERLGYTPYLASNFLGMPNNDDILSSQHLRKTGLGNTLTVRQFLSALSHIACNDPFVLEKTRNAQIHSKKYTEYFIKGPRGNELKRYVDFFTMITDIVDKNQLPEGMPLNKLRATLRDGGDIISNAMRIERALLKHNMDIRENPDMIDHERRALARQVLMGIYPKNITGSTLEKLKRKVEEIDRTINLYQTDLTPQDEAFILSEEKIDRIVTYMRVHRLIDMQHIRATVHDTATETAEMHEDNFAGMADVRSRLRQAYNISTRSRGGFNRGSL